MDNSYCETKLKNIIEPLFLNLLIERPSDIVHYSIEWLMKKGGMTSNGLTIDERNELINLRNELKKYRELEAEKSTYNINSLINKKPDHHSDEEDDDEEDIDPEVADDRRDSKLRGPRIAVSAEVYGTFHKKEDFKPKINIKTEEQVTAIKARLIQSFLFNCLEAKELKIIIDAMEETKASKGETIINQGDYGDCLYIVEKGDLECYKTFSNFEEKLVKRYTSGEAFGELSLLYNAPRAAKVIAINNVVLYRLDRETFNAIVKDAAM